MPTVIINTTLSNGELLSVAHYVPEELFTVHKDLINAYKCIFDHVRNTDELPDELASEERYLDKEKEFIHLLHNIHKIVYGCYEVMLQNTMTIDLTINK